MREQLAWFDHVYGVVDQTTADAIERSPLLRELCPVKVSTVSTGERSWHGRYVHLPSSYVEFFGPGDDAELGPHATGVGISTRSPGAIDEVAAALGALNPRVGTQEREEGGARVPWFKYADVSLPDRPVLSAWAMEYVGEDGGAVRAARYADWLAAAPGGPRLLDVTTVEICAPGEEIERTARLLVAAGFAVETDGGTATARDGAVTLELRASESHGLRRLVCGLSSPPGHEVAEELGRSLLVLGPDTTAVWEFSAGCPL